jgi:hypothetical protein
MNTFLPRFHVGAGTQRGSLTLFPVWVEGAATRGIGWRSDPLVVEERTGNAVVAELVIRNTSDRPRAIVEGDLFIGGQQDRTAAETMVLDAGEARVLPVRCVEHGRWGGGEESHRATSLRTPYSVRYGTHAGSAVPLDQGEVWERISRLERRHGMSRTSALTDHLAHSRRYRVAGGVDQATAGPAASTIPDVSGLRPLDGQRGVIVGIGGRVAAAEVFGSEYGLKTRWKGILDAAALDAAGHQPIATSGTEAREFAARMLLTPRRDASRGRGIRHIAAADGQTAIATSWTTDAAGHRTGMLHLTAFNRAHPVLV